MNIVSTFRDKLKSKPNSTRLLYTRTLQITETDSLHHQSGTIDKSKTKSLELLQRLFHILYWCHLYESSTAGSPFSLTPKGNKKERGKREKQNKSSITLRSIGCKKLLTFCSNPAIEKSY